MDEVMLGRKLLLNHLSEDECENILKVIQRDFTIRQQEKERLSLIEEEITEEDQKVSILAKKQEFNENCCMRCFARFYFLFKTKVQCVLCKFYVCKTCAAYDGIEKDYVCNVCMKQRELKQQSCEWFYENVRERFKRFGGAKVVRSLYKRRTESEESDYAMSDSAVFGGSKKRPHQLKGHFEMDLDNNKSSRTGGNGNMTDVEQSSSKSRKMADYHNNNKSLRFDIVRERELKDFRHRFNTIVEDMQNTIESSTQNGSSHFESLLDSHRSRLCLAIARMSQSLHIALDNQDITDPSAIICPTAAGRQQLVRQIIATELETFLAKPVSIKDDDITSEYGSECGTEPNTQGNPKTTEDIFADMVINKILADYRNQENGNHLQQAYVTLSSLPTNDTQNGQVLEAQDNSNEADHRPSATETHSTSQSTGMGESDTELAAIDISSAYEEMPLQEPILTLQQVPLMSEKGPAVSQFNEDYLWRQVEHLSNSVEIQTEGLSIEARQIQDEQVNKVLGVCSVEVQVQLTEPTIVPCRDVDNMTHDVLEIVQYADDVSENIAAPITNRSEELAEQTELNSSFLQLHEVHELLTEGDDPLIKNQSKPGDEPEDNEELNEEQLLQYAASRDVPLPGFGYEKHSERDLDDISWKSEEDSEALSDVDEEDDDAQSSRSSTRSENWSFYSGLFRNRAIISPYDNYGDKKVGRDTGGPTYMFVPSGLDLKSSIPKIGEHDATELSDLSDAEGSDDNSDKTDDTLENEDMEVDGHFDNEGHFVVGNRSRPNKKSHAVQRSDSGVQTEEPSLELGTDMTIDFKTKSGEHDHDLLQKIKKKKLLTRPESPEVSDIDPRFDVKPEKVVTVMEGDNAKICVEVNGTQPIDVFWYRQSDDLLDLAETDDCELSVADRVRHKCCISGCGPDDQGRYLVVAINNVGRCSREFVLIVTPFVGEKAAPEFICPLAEVTVSEGQSVKLRTKIKGYPQPKVIWRKDGRLLQKSDRYRPGKIGNRDYVLSMDYVTFDDDAEFTVIAKNSSGEARSSANIMVVEPVRQVSAAVVSPRSHVPSSLLTTSFSSDIASRYPDTDTLLKIASGLESTHGDSTRLAEELIASVSRSDDSFQMDKVQESTKRTLQDFNYMADQYKDPVFTSMKLPQKPDDIILRAEHLLKQERSKADYLRTTDENNIPTINYHTLATVMPVAPPELEDFHHVPSLAPTEFAEFPSAPSGFQDDSSDEVELNLTYEEFECLFNAGKISWEQARQGRLTKSQMNNLRAFLENLTSDDRKHLLSLSADSFDPEEKLSIDCGPKRIDSKRYKRDYFIVRNSPQVQRKKWEVHMPSAVGTEIVRQEETVKGEEVQSSGFVSTTNQKFGDNSAEASIQRVSQLEKRQSTDQSQLAEMNNERSPATHNTISKTSPQTDFQLGKHEKGQTLVKTPEDVFVLPPRFDHVKAQFESISMKTEQNIKAEARKSSTGDDKTKMGATAAGVYVTDAETLSPKVNKVEVKTETLKVNKMEVRSELVVPKVNRNVSTLTVQASVAAADTKVSTASLNRQESLRSEPEQPSVLEEPDSSSEWNEGTSLLPSVKNLRLMFNQNEKQENEAGIRRVYSLTGRDVPQTVRNQLRQRHMQTDVESSKTKQSHVKSIFEESAAAVEVSLTDCGYSTFPYKDNYQRHFNNSLLSTNQGVMGSPKENLILSLKPSELSLRGESFDNQSGDEQHLSRSDSSHDNASQSADHTHTNSWTNDVSQSEDNKNVLNQTESSNDNIEQSNDNSMTISPPVGQFEHCQHSISLHVNNSAVVPKITSTKSKDKVALDVNENTKYLSNNIEIKPSLTPEEYQKVPSTSKTYSYTVAPGASCLKKQEITKLPVEGKSPVILARAAFWDSRVKASDDPDVNVVDEFPDMPEEALNRL